MSNKYNRYIHKIGMTCTIGIMSRVSMTGTISTTLSSITRTILTASSTRILAYHLLPALRQVFEEYARMSGLTLNIKKTAIIPLHNRSPQATKCRVQEKCKEWADATIATEGTYLGFQIGPSSTGKSWDKPLPTTHPP